MRAGARRGSGGDGEDGGDGRGRGGGGYEGCAEPAEEASVSAARSPRNIVGVSSRGPAGELGPGRTCCAGPGRGAARPHRPRAHHSTPLRCFLPGRGLTRVSSGTRALREAAATAGEDCLVVKGVVGSGCLQARGGSARLPSPVESEKPGFLRQPPLLPETSLLETERRRTRRCRAWGSES